MEAKLKNFWRKDDGSYALSFRKLDGNKDYCNFKDKVAMQAVLGEASNKLALLFKVCKNLQTSDIDAILTAATLNINPVQVDIKVNSTSESDVEVIAKDLNVDTDGTTVKSYINNIIVDIELSEEGLAWYRFCLEKAKY